MLHTYDTIWQLGLLNTLKCNHIALNRRKYSVKTVFGKFSIQENIFLFFYVFLSFILSFFCFFLSFFCLFFVFSILKYFLSCLAVIGKFIIQVNSPPGPPPRPTYVRHFCKKYFFVFLSFLYVLSFCVFLRLFASFYVFLCLSVSFCVFLCLSVSFWVFLCLSGSMKISCTYLPWVSDLTWNKP